MHSTIVDIFEARINRSGPDIAARFLSNNRWESVSWNRWWELSERLAAGLMELGVRKGDRVAILSDTRFEWALLDIAILMCGGVTVPLFPSNLPRVIGSITEDSRPKVIIAEDPSQVAKLLAVKDKVGAKHVVCLESIAAFDKPDWAGNVETRLSDLDYPAGWVLSYDELLDRGRRRISSDHRSVIDRRTDLKSSDLASIVYTSGTGASPKGVELTHLNLVSEVTALTELELLSSDDVQLLFLPMAHIFARVLYLTAIGYGIPTAFLGSVSDLSQALGSVAPTFFAGVPHVFQKIRNRLMFDAHRFGGVRSTLFDAAYADGLKTKTTTGTHRPGMLERAKSRVYDELVYSRVRERFGGEIRMLISGGASLPRDLAEFYFALGIPVLEGFGLTETTAVATVNVIDEFRIGTVGRPLPGVEVTIAEDGEILVRGKSVMRGYHRDAAATREAIDDEGWLHTGDLGEYDRDGFLKITGRKKDIIVTASGKNIGPQHLESALAGSPFVDQAIVFGDNRPFVVALLTLSDPNIEAWAQQTSTELERPLSSSRVVRTIIEEHVADVNSAVAAFSTIKRFAIMPEDLASDPEFLTPTNKLRREFVAEKCADLIDSLYKEV